MGRLFGTDGIRGIANTEISCELAIKTGRACAMVLKNNTGKKKPRIIIGTDTRISADMLCSALTAGFCSCGCDVFHLGVVPTPAVAFLVKELNCDAGVMISASHNTFEYNGIKIFMSDGYKLPDETEDEIERIILDDVSVHGFSDRNTGTVKIINTAVDKYIRHLKGITDFCFSDIKAAVDCANGSASVTARKLFDSLGTKSKIINSDPDGKNINADCGSTHIECLQDFMHNGSFDIGFAFDGDADRLLCVDSDGNLVDGDKIIAVCAKYMKKLGKLRYDTAVVTVMSNLGLIRFFEKNSIKYEMTAVGDRYVLEKMLLGGYNLGGEQSGHIIFSDYATTGDGQLTAVFLLNIMKATGLSLKELTDEIEIYPQVLRNVRVSSLGKLRLSEDEEIKTAIKKAEQELGSDGRVLVRASGTESLVRIMAEGKELGKIQKLTELIADVIKERLI